MSWAKPFGPYESGVLIDRDAINETLARYSWELSYLNESNFDFGSAATPLLFSVSEDGNLADDFACQLYHTATSVSPYATTGDAWKITESTIWDVVDSMELTIDTKGGMFLVFASFQVSNRDTSIRTPGHFFAIGIDNNPQVESLIGSGDEGNDPAYDPLDRVLRGATTPARPATNVSLFSGFAGAGPGIRYPQVGLSTQWAGYLPPGEVRISLMVREAEAAIDDVADDFYITCRELIVLETHGTP